MNAHKKEHSTYTKNDSHETRIALLEQSISHINETLMRIENRLDKLDNRLWQIIFLISSSVIGLVLAKIFHWF